MGEYVDGGAISSVCLDGLDVVSRGSQIPETGICIRSTRLHDQKVDCHEYFPTGILEKAELVWGTSCFHNPPLGDWEVAEDILTYMRVPSKSNGVSNVTNNGGRRVTLCRCRSLKNIRSSSPQATENVLVGTELERYIIHAHGSSTGGKTERKPQSLLAFGSFPVANVANVANVNVPHYSTHRSTKQLPLRFQDLGVTGLYKKSGPYTFLRSDRLTLPLGTFSIFSISACVSA